MDALSIVLAVLAALFMGLCALCLRAKSRAERELAIAQEQAKSQLARAEALLEEKDLQDETLDELRRELTAARERVAGLEASKEALEHRLSEQPKELQKMQETLQLQFNKEANTLFEAITKKFSTQSEKQLGDILTPLRERLGEFQKLVTESFGTQGKEQHTLKAEIARIVSMNEQMRLQTESLTKALRGDVKAQGNWGEVILERILEESGLQKGIGYTVQGEQMGLANADGGRQQPDVIIHLPEGKHIIIDSKVSLTHYERYCNPDEEQQQDANLKLFLNSLRAHIKGLEGKSYHANEKLISPDFVLMFLPIEGAFSLAMQHDPELHHFAWERQIVLVCPSTLFATLRTVASLWRIDQQNKNSQEIARRGGLLYDKFVGFVGDMQAIGRNIGQTQKAYEGAMGKLSEGTGNLVGQAEKLRDLGAKPTSRLPKELLGTEVEAAPKAISG